MFNSRARAEKAVGSASASGNAFIPAIDTSSLQYPSRLNFYSQPPTSDITIEEFETWAINRLKSVTLFF